MSQEEQEKQHPCKEAQFVNDNSAALIERVASVMPLADVLRSKNMINKEKYSEIKAEKTNQDKMRMLFEALNAGGDEVKTAFYQELHKCEPYLFKSLGGENRKRKLSDSECQVETKYKKPNTENEKQIINQFVTQAPQHNVTIVQAQKPVPTTVLVNSPNKPLFQSSGFLNQKCPAIKTERKTPALMKKTPATKKEKKPPATNKVKKPPATKKEKKPPATQKEKKPPATNKVKKPPATNKVKKPPATQKVKKPPATQKEKKPPATQKEKKPPATQSEKKPPATQKEKKPPATKKEKKPPATKKVKKPPATKKVKKPPATKKVKKPPATKKVKKPPAPKKEKKRPVPKK